MIDDVVKAQVTYLFLKKKYSRCINDGNSSKYAIKNDTQKNLGLRILHYFYWFVFFKN